MKNKTVLGITIPTDSKINTLEHIQECLFSNRGFCHVVSLNPENIVLTYENEEFRKVVTAAQIQIVDGIGVVVAARLLGLPVGQRLAGVDLMDTLIERALESSLPVMLIGAPENLAEELAQCYQSRYPEAKIVGTQGVANIKNISKDEEDALFSIVTATKPRLVFVAFGSPAQEQWLWLNRDKFGNCVCIGVGGAFDYLSGRVGRAPGFIRTIGLEWLVRLITQPWRWKRQIRLLKFIWLVLLQRFGVL